MPRLRRHVRPGALIHIIVRFVNHEYLLDSAELRREYLRRARRTFRRSDWRALSFALMSTHTHFAAIAGHKPFADLSRPLHAGFVGWLNPRKGRLGAGVANRPATHDIAFDQSARLLAYIHNNPVRAGVVASAADTDWTSHRWYAEGIESDWLDIPLGLELAGFDATPQGRRGFADLVDRSVDDEWSISDDDLAGIRRRARRTLGRSIELGQPRVGEQVSVSLWSPDSARIEPLRERSLESMADAVAAHCGITPDVLASGDRSHAAGRGRRMFVLVARRHAGRSLTETAAFLGISLQAASKHAKKADACEVRAACEIARAITPEPKG